MPTPAIPPVLHRPHIAVLEYRVDVLAKKLKSALGRILVMERARLNVTPTRVTPTFEVIPTAPLKCKHGLREAWCAPCADRSRSGEQNPNRDKYLDGWGRWSGPLLGNQLSIAFDACVIEGLEEVESVDYLADQEADVPLNYCSPVKTFVTPSKREPWSEVEERTWLHVKSVEPKFGDALSLAEYAHRHQDDEDATLPHLPRYCDACREHVTVLHDMRGCATTMLAEQQARAARIEKRREQTANNVRRVLLEQGLWSGDYLALSYDRNNAEEREAMVKQFDRDLSRKGNKYRIQ